MFENVINSHFIKRESHSSQTKPLNRNAKLIINQTNQFLKPQIPSLRIIHFVLSFYVTLTLFYHFIFTFIWENALV